MPSLSLNISWISRPRPWMLGTATFSHWGSSTRLSSVGGGGDGLRYIFVVVYFLSSSHCINIDTLALQRTSLVAQTVKHLSTMWETRVQSLGWEEPLEKEMAIHTSTVAWKIPWTEEPGRLQFMGSQRVRHDWKQYYFEDAQTKFERLFKTPSKIVTIVGNPTLSPKANANPMSSFYDLKVNTLSIWKMC